MIRHFKGLVVLAFRAMPLLGVAQALAYARAFSQRTPTVFTAHYKGKPFRLRAGDWFSVCEVLLEHEYKVVADCLKNVERPVVLDLGSNIGAFSLYVLSQFPKAVVHGYEASLATYTLLLETQKLNAGLDWHPHYAAAWREDGTVSFETSALSTGSHVSAGGGETVPGRSLNSILADAGAHVNVMKVDIEGAEAAFLAGQADALQNVDHLIVELHPGRCDTDAVVVTLRQAFSYLYAISGRASSKPLLLATRRGFNLPLYAG